MLLPPQSLLSARGGGSNDKEEVGQDSSQGSKMANYSFEQQVIWLKRYILYSKACLFKQRTVKLYVFPISKEVKHDKN